MLKELIKTALVVAVFFVGAPIMGALLKNRRGWQRAAFALMCFMTINGLMAEGNWGKTLMSIEWYRGHTKGFHFYFNEALAIALIVARGLEQPKALLRIPAGLPIYLMYCFLSSVSLFTAPEPLFVVMAAHKMLFVLVIFLATYHFIRSPDDIAFFLKTMAATLCWEAFVVLKMKYLDGIYQVRGTFEHQNPLSMYAIMIGMVFLASALATRNPSARWCAAAFMACGIIVQSALSRAGLVIFAGGVVGIVGLSLLERITARRAGFVAMMALVGSLGLALTLDTIVARFGDRGNAASSELRDVLNEASRRMAQDRFFGVGWNNYGLAINHPYPYAEVVYAWLEDRNMPVDYDSPNALVESHYYLLLAENGYLGYGSYILLIVSFLWRNLRAAIAFGPGLIRWVSLGIAAGCTLNYTQSLLERVLTQPRNLMLWMILLGLTSRIEACRTDRRKPFREERLPTVNSPLNQKPDKP